LIGERDDAPPPDIRLDAALRETIETPLRSLQAEVASGTITRKRAINLIAEVECTEWNEIFLYVVGTFGPRTRDTERTLALVQEHERRTEAFVAGLPAHVRPEADLGKLARIWDTRLLVVDDHALVRELLAGLLKSTGRVSTAADGEEALAAIRRHFFDAVVSDLQMPNVSGLDLYRQTVAEHPDMRGRFVFVSFDPNLSDREFIEKNGLPLLLKPCEPEDLIVAVASITAGVPDAGGVDDLR
jgi:CheY-like chemotaxis protein